jgi:hypothetical protein
LGTVHSYYTKALRVTKTDLRSKSLAHLEWIAADAGRAAYVRELHVVGLPRHEHRPDGLWDFGEWCQPVLPQPASQRLQNAVRDLYNSDSFSFLHTEYCARSYDTPSIAAALAIVLPAVADSGRKIKEFRFETNDESSRALTPFIKMNPVKFPYSPDLWSNLEYLNLGVVWPSDKPPTINFRLHILPHAASLRKLALDFNCENRVEGVPELLESLLTNMCASWTEGESPSSP